MISYESCNWYTRLWRKRWYLYAIFLHIKNYIDVELWIDLILNQIGFDVEDEKKSKKIKYEIKRHVELSKMYKFSTKYNRENDEN